MRVIGFGVALLVSSTVAQKGKDAAPVASKGGDDAAITYSCPKGWEQDGENCSRSTTVRSTTKTETNYNEVPAIETCPYGFVLEKDTCLKTEVVSKIARVVTKQVPEKQCPAGTSKNAEGSCFVTKTVTKKVAVPTQKAAKSQRVTKKSDLVSVKRPVAAPGPVQCPKGTRVAGQTCIQTVSLPGYELVDVTKELKVPHDEKVITESCGKGGKGPCTVDLGPGTQYVKEVTNEKTVTITQLTEKLETLTLKSQVKVPQLVCPEGSEATKDGCVVAVTKQVVTKKSIPRQIPSAASFTKTVEKTLAVSKTTLGSSSACPAGSYPSGKGSLKCIVSRQVQVPTPREVNKTVRVSRAVKVPRTVRVPKTVAVATEECPKGAEPFGKGLCALTTTIKVPYTVDVPVEVCPAGSTQSKSGSCSKEVVEYYTPEDDAAAASAASKDAPPAGKKDAAPAPTKTMKGGKGGAGASGGAAGCPSGYTDEGGICTRRFTEQVATETLMASKLAYREEVIRETVPAIVSYSTRTEYVDATVEEIHIENDYETVTETVIDLVTSTVQEEIPAVVSYGPQSNSETVTVVDTVLCGEQGKKGGISACGDATEEVFETVLEVSTETHLEEVPKVFAYTVESHIDTQEVRAAVVTSTPTTITEVTHIVESEGCSGAKGACVEEIPASKTVSFKTSYETIVAVDKKVKPAKHSEEVAVQGTPTFNTVYEEESLPSVRLEVETVPIVLEELKLESQTETLTQEVEAATVYRSSISTEEGCPDGTRTEASGCVKVSTAPKKVSCPSGSLQRNGGCYEKETITVPSCPPGSTLTGDACVQKETIPATATYAASSSSPAASKDAPQPSKDAPQPTKEAPHPTKAVPQPTKAAPHPVKAEPHPAANKKRSLFAF